MAKEFLNSIHARYADWSNLNWADGEYQDFTKFDFARAEKEGIGAAQLEFRLKSMTKGVRIERLSQMDENEGETIGSKLLSSPGLEPSPKQDKLMAWHGAHAQDGFVIRVAAGVSAPLIYLRSVAAGHSALHHTIILEDGATAEVILEMIGGEEKKNEENSPARLPQSANTPARLHTDVSEAILGADAKLCFTTIQRYGENDWAFGYHGHILGKFAELTHVAGAFGAGVSRTRTLNQLSGGRAKANAYQLFFGRGSQFMDMETHSHHMTADTSGEMTCRGALDGTASMVYRGRIHIERAAPNTISHQSGSALLLSPDSAANIIPSLQVDNDQVEAGHGASVGALDEAEVNYLRSRGLDEQDARLLILRGYFDELIGKIWGESSRRYLSGLVGTRLPKMEEKRGKKEKKTAGARRPSRRTKTRPLAVPGLEARPSAHTGLIQIADE